MDKKKKNFEIKAGFQHAGFLAYLIFFAKEHDSWVGIKNHKIKRKKMHNQQLQEE